MDNRKKSNFKLVAATGMTIFSLLTTFVGVFAWFTSIRKVDNGANQFAITSTPGKLESVSLYDLDSWEINEQDSSKKDLQFKSTPEVTKTFDWGTGNSTVELPFVMSQYSILSQFHPVLLVFKLHDKFTCSADTPLSLRGKTEYPFLGSGSLSSEEFIESCVVKNDGGKQILPTQFRHPLLLRGFSE